MFDIVQIESDFLKKVAIAIAGGLIMKLLTFAYKAAVNFIFKTSNYTVSGYWISDFQSYVDDNALIEVVMIAQNRENLKIRIQQFRETGGPCRWFQGKEFTRRITLSGICFEEQKQSTERSDHRNSGRRSARGITP